MTKEMVQQQLLSYEGGVELRLVPDAVPEQQIQSQKCGGCDRHCQLAISRAAPVCRSVHPHDSCSARTGLSVCESEERELNTQRFAVVKVC